MKNLSAIVLAAGKGTRMKSARPKVLHEVAGLPMLSYPVNVLKALKAKNIVIVIGHGGQSVKDAFGAAGVSFAVQDEQLGTGHAVICGMKRLKDADGDVVILSGDVPLVTPQTIKGLLKIHSSGGKNRPALSLITALLEDPSGYGRVVRDAHNRIASIVEDKDCTPAQREISEINTGIYLADSGFLKDNLKRIGTGNKQGEYYLPDLVALAVSSGARVAAMTHIDATEVMGVNNRVDLARANALMKERIAEGLMRSGVTIVDPANTYIDSGVKVGQDTVIYPGVHLIGRTVVGKDCMIEEGCRIEGSSIGDGSVIKSYSVIESTVAGRAVVIGPFARIRPGSVLGEGVRIGNFVEVKKTRMGKGTKANHLSYLGDAVIGAEVNIGAGTITCNYDGVHKHTTIIEDGAFIGSDSQLVAPVRVGKNAYVGSGTTVTKDVPPGALVITRTKERVIEGWGEKKKAEKK